MTLAPICASGEYNYGFNSWSAKLNEITVNVLISRHSTGFLNCDLP